MSDGRRYQVAALAVFLLGVAMRTLPMYRSPLPVKADGLFHASYTAETVRTGAFPLVRMGTDDLGFASLLAQASLVTGVDPWYVAQPASAVVGAAPVLLVVALARRLCRRRGWAAGRARTAGLLAGAFLAVEGLYLHRSMVTDEQTVGLLLVPLALVALYRGYRTDRPAWWAAGAVLLAVLPPLHNLDAMVAALALTVLVAFAATAGRLDRGFGTLVGATAAFWAAFAGYHLLVARHTPARIVQEARFTDVPGLVVAWLVAGALVVAWSTRTRPRTQRAVGWSVFAVMFGLVAVNAWRAVFPGMPRTPTVVLAMLSPLALPAALAAWRLPDLLPAGSDGPPLFALVASVTALVGVSLTAALTPVYLGTAYRTSLFLHVPVAVPVGVGTVAVMHRRPFETRAALRVAVAGLVVASAVVSVPLAFGGLAPFNYRSITTPGELAGAEFAAAHVDGAWAADDHDRRVADAVAVGTNATWEPVYEWLVDGRPPPDCPTLVHRSWTTRGTQFLTTAPVRLPRSAYRAVRTNGSVVYDGGGRDRLSLVIPRDGGGPGC